MEKDELDYYGKYANLIETTEAQIMSELKQIIKEMTGGDEESPAEHILCRIKHKKSITKKLEKKGLATDAKTALENLSDEIGIRVVTHFVGEVYAVLDKIKSNSKWQIVKIKDYIANPKSNGYRSLHVIIKIPVENYDIKNIRAEIQLRTVAMDCWASLEHKMKYKKNIPESDLGLITSELKRCADEIASTDLSMQTINEMIAKEGENNK